MNAREWRDLGGWLPGTESISSTGDNITAERVAIPKSHAAGIVSKNRKSLTVLALVIILTAIWGWFIFKYRSQMPDVVMYPGAVVFALGASTVIVWFGLFYPIYINPARTAAVAAAHAGSAVWVIYTGVDLRKAWETLDPTSAAGVHSWSKGFMSVGENAVVFWRQDGAACMAFPKRLIRSATLQDVRWGPDSQPGVVLSVGGDESSAMELGFIPAPRGFERRTRAMALVLKAFQGPATGG